MKIKICHVLSDVDQSHLIETFGEIMDKARYEVSFVFIGPKEPHLFGFFKGRGYKTEFFQFNGRRELPQAILKLRSIFKRYKPDIVHTHMVDGSLVGLIAAKTLGIKSRVHTRHHGIEAHFYYPHGVYYDRINNLLSKKIAAISRVVADALIEREGVSPGKVKTIPHGFYLENFAADEDAVKDLRKRYDLEENYPVVGSISRFIHWKGVQHTILSFKELLETHPKAKLVLANASGPYSAEIQELLEKNLPPENYLTIKFERNVFALYKTFDVFVHVPVSKDFEAFGQVYVEALAMEIPSIFTLSGIANDFIKDGENALVVPYEDAAAIAAALRWILQNPEFRNKLINRGKQDVWKTFHADRFGDQLDALYTELNQ